MIVPGNRALWGFAVTVLPAALACGQVPRGWVFLAWAGLVYLAVAVMDAIMVLLRGRNLGAAFPDRVDLARNREGSLRITVKNGGGRTLAARLELELPEELRSSPSPLRVTIPPGGERIALDWAMTGLERGVYRLGACRIGFSSPLGLWSDEKSLPAGTMIRVYPNLMEERKRLASLFLHRNDARVHPRRQVGQGREFEKLRTYLPGDTMGDVHWRATAKRGHPIVKEYQIERTQEIYAVVDASRLSARRQGKGPGAAGDTLLEGCLTSSLLLGSIAQRQGDLFGVMTFSDRPLAFVKAGAGTGHFGVCREALSMLQPSLVTPNFEETAAFLANRLRRRALLVFLTSLDEPALAESFLRSMRVLARRHLVIATTLRPPLAAPLFGTGEARDPDAVYGLLGGHLVWHDLKSLKETLKFAGIEFALVERNDLCAEMVARYMEVKRRQRL